MYGHDEHVLAFTQFQQLHPEERPMLQIEWLARLFTGQAFCLNFPLILRGAAYVHYFQTKRYFFGDDLSRLTFNCHKMGAQRLVPAHDLGEAVSESIKIQWPFKPHSAGNVVRRSARRKLVNEPHPLLCVRKGHHRSGVSRRDQWRHRTGDLFSA